MLINRIHTRRGEGKAEKDSLSLCVCSYLLAGLSLGTGLRGDEAGSDHLRCVLLDGQRILRDLDTTLESVCEVSLSSSTCVHLRFDDEFGVRILLEQLSRDRLRLVGCGCDHTLLHAHVVLGHQSLGLVLVQVEVADGGAGDGSHGPLQTGGRRGGSMRGGCGGSQRHHRASCLCGRNALHGHGSRRTGGCEESRHGGRRSVGRAEAARI